MKYRKVNYKYVLEEDYYICLPELLYTISTRSATTFIDVFVNTTERTRKLKIHMGYAWDGCSGPTIDTEGTMEASLVHDALYQLIRLKSMPLSMRKPADKLFLHLLRRRGVNKIRRWYFYLAVRLFGKKAAQP